MHSLLLTAALIACHAGSEPSPTASANIAPSVAPSAAPATADDLAAIARIRTALLGHLVSDWDTADATPRALGFDLERRTALFASSPGRCSATIVSTGGDVVEVRAMCTWRFDDFDAARDDLERALAPAFRVVVDDAHARLRRVVATARTTSTPLTRAALERAASALGPLVPVAVADDLAASYDELSSPTSSVALGSVCNFGRAPGLASVRALRAAGRVDLLRNVLRGLNPEGRWYAALALRDMGVANRDDLRLIGRLRTVTPSVVVCEADETMHAPSARADEWIARNRGLSAPGP